MIFNPGFHITTIQIILISSFLFLVGEGEGGVGPGGVLRISCDGDDQMDPKVKTQKNP